MALLGGRHDDTLAASNYGGELLHGGSGKDTLYGYSGSDVIYGGSGDDGIDADSGNDWIFPGPGKDYVLAGSGDDEVRIHDLCEVESGEKLYGESGTDRLITPVSVSALQSMGVTVSSFEIVTIEQHSCESQCGRPVCVHGTCVEGSGPGEVHCDCEPGWGGSDCSDPCTDTSDNDVDSLNNCSEDFDATAWTDKNIFNGVLVAEAPICHSSPSCSLVDTRAEIEACYAGMSGAEERPMYSGWDFEDVSSLELCNPEYGFLPGWSGCPGGQNGAQPYQLHYQGRIYLGQSGKHCFKASGSSSNACGALLVGSQTNAVTTADGTVCYTLPAGEQPIRFFYETKGISTPGATLLAAYFSQDADGYTFLNDAFYNTNEPNYASAYWGSSFGYSGGGLKVKLGNVDTSTVIGMSGAVKKTVTLGAPADVTLSFKYNLVQSSEYESDEYSRALASVDGILRGQGGNDYLDQIFGDGNGGYDRSTGWKFASLPLGVLGAGSHTILLGGYNNKKTYSDEYTYIYFDNVVVESAASLGGGSFRAKYCFGGASTCSPTEAIPQEMLRLPTGVCGPSDGDSTCPAPANPCLGAFCGSATGACLTYPVDGVACDDGNPATTGEICVHGTCTPPTTPPAELDCEHHILYENELRTNPAFRQQQQDLERQIRDFETRRAADPVGTTPLDIVRVPVVVHVIEYTGPVDPLDPNDHPEVTDAHVTQMLAKLNDNFSTVRSSEIRDVFKPDAGSTPFRFELARRSPGCGNLPPIQRAQTDQEELSEGRYTSLSSRWDPTSYLNIYVAFLNDFVKGELHFASDTIAVDPNEAIELSSTLTHEVGHWLSLLHVDTYPEDSCSSVFDCKNLGDQICDTPASNGLRSRCVESPPIDSCSGLLDPDPDMVENYMNTELAAAVPSCRVMFTNDQVTRMEATMLTRRAGIVNSDGLLDPPPDPSQVPGDLYSKDTPFDRGNEPNLESDVFWVSPDIEVNGTP